MEEKIPQSAVAVPTSSAVEAKPASMYSFSAVGLPLTLFFATCLSTFWTGAVDWKPFSHLDGFERSWASFWQNLPQGFTPALNESLVLLQWKWGQGLAYMLSVMAILVTHEAGHFVFACRYRLPSGLPHFIPVPVLPFGTMGAVISLEGSEANRRQLFDLGLMGPGAGLLVTLPIMWIGIMQLPTAPLVGEGFRFHNPLIMQLLIEYLRPDYPTPTEFFLNQFNPYLMAGWVGLFITGLNMLPISQLDGGHVAYAMFDRGAHSLARGVLILSIIFVLLTEQYGWIVMLIVIILLGVDHPETADDRIELNNFRRALGWLALLIPILCLSPIGITPPGR